MSCPPPLSIIVVAIMVSTGCYSPSFRECAVQCAENLDCPGGSSCAIDGFCHAVDTAGIDCAIVQGGDGGLDDARNESDASPVAGPCARPFLVASLESFDEQGGRVLRFALNADGTTSACTDLTAGGGLPDQPLALAWVPPTGLAVASRDQTHLLDATTDAILWTTPRGADALPRDALLMDQNGDSRLVIGLNDTTSLNSIRPLEIYDLADGTLLDTASTSPSVRSIARNPRDPSMLLELKVPVHAAQEREPVTGAVLDNPAYVNQPADMNLQSVHALVGTPARLVWTGTIDGSESLFYFNDPGFGESGKVPLGPIRCGTDLNRKYIKAVPDPTLNTRFIALTELNDGTREIVRFKTSSTDCDTIFSSASLPMPARSRISHMAVVEAAP